MLDLKVLRSFNNFSPTGYIDIGANTGQYAAEMIKSHPTIKNVLLIEANTKCAEHLKKLPWNYEICLLSDSEKELDYYTDPKNPTGTGNSYLKENTKWFQDSTPLAIKSATLDRVMRNYRGNFDFIKIDTQGSELDILKGATKTILEAKYILLECSVDGIADYNQGAPGEAEIIKYLHFLGFRHSAVINEHIWRSRNAHTQEMPFGAVFQKDILFSRDRMKRTLATYSLNMIMFIKKIIIRTSGIHYQVKKRS